MATTSTKMDFSLGDDEKNSDSESSASEQEQEPISKSEQDEWPETEYEKQLSVLLFGDRDALLENLGDKSKAVEVKGNDDVDKKKRAPAWVDSDDEDIDKNLAPRVNKKRKRDQKLLQSQMTSTYTENLKNKFERLVGQPQWASLDKAEKEVDSDDEILQSIGHIKGKSKVHSTSNLLNYKRVADLNKASYKEGPVITGIEFHPTSSIAVVAGKFGIASVFSVDGQENNKLHTVGMKDFNITCCRISRNGEEVIFGGPKRHYFVYDLMSGKSNTQRLPQSITHLKLFELSTCGKWLAAAGRFGEVHLFNAFSKELIHTMKQENPCTALCFSQTNSNYLYSHSDSGEVAIFDIRAEKICQRWTDEGCINGSSISVSANDQLIATGSQQGVVNVYDREKVFASSFPKPEKAIMNLTTEITNTVFHPSNEMLAISSVQVADAIRMIQLPKITAYQNFPLANNKLGYTRVVRFSPDGGYMAIAGTKALLYRLKNYNSY